jgi:hypothetical protein
MGGTASSIDDDASYSIEIRIEGRVFEAAEFHLNATRVLWCFGAAFS